LGLNHLLVNVLSLKGVCTHLLQLRVRADHRAPVGAIGKGELTATATTTTTRFAG
jgi:hypothetical protein